MVHRTIYTSMNRRGTTTGLGEDTNFKTMPPLPMMRKDMTTVIAESERAGAGEENTAAKGDIGAGADQGPGSNVLQEGMNWTGC